MSGWDPRRTSGEIINATLLEIFLALVFIIFALAIFQEQRAAKAESLLRAAPDAAAVAALRDSLAVVRKTAETRGDSLRRVRVRLDSLLFASQYAPDCERGSVPEEWLTITLAGPGQLLVRANRPRFGLDAGTAISVGAGSFASRFADAHAYSLSHGCRFLAKIEDTPHTSKADYKALMAVISSVFRTRNSFHQ